MEKIPSEQIIRCSTLDAYADCSLRAAVHAWPQLFRRHGYEIAPREPHIALMVGNVYHGSAASVSRAQAAGLEVEIKDAVEEAFAGEFEKLSDKEITYDELTPNRHHAQKQIDKMVRSYWGTLGYKTAIHAVEKRYTIDLEGLVGIPGYYLSGQPDTVTKDPDMYDHKTTGKKAVKKLYLMQTGGYRMVLKGHGITPRKVGTITMRRMPADEDASRPMVASYSPPAAEYIAKMTIKRIVYDRERFNQTGDPMVFGVNPESNLCSPRYCNAYGTPICPVWKAKEALKAAGGSK